MQSYTEIADSATIEASRALLLGNDKTIMSCFSGTAFPTTNLQVGMLCLRTDQWKLYQLKETAGPTWVLICDLSKTYLSKEAADALYALPGHNHDSAYQPLTTILSAIAAISTNGLIKRTGTGTVGIVAMSAFIEGVMDSADAAAFRTSLGLTAAATTALGNGVGQIPTVQADGRLPASIMPPGAYADGGAKTASFTVAATDGAKLFRVAPAAATTVTLPAPAAVGAGFWVAFLITGATAAVTLSTPSGLIRQLSSPTTLNTGTASIALTTLGMLQLFCDGTNWIVLENDQASVANSYTSGGTSATATGFRLSNGTDIGSLYKTGYCSYCNYCGYCSYCTYCNCHCTCCFPEDTDVILADGSSKAIKDVRPGETVRGTFGDENVVLHEVVCEVQPGEMLYVVNGDLKMTGEHLLWSGEAWLAVNKAFYADHQDVLAARWAEKTGGNRSDFKPQVPAAQVRQLEVGDLILRNGVSVEVRSFEAVEVTEPQVLRSLSLDGSATFIASGYGVEAFSHLSVEDAQ